MIKQDLDTADPAYWEKLLRHHWEQQQEDVGRTLGKGKRLRKPVNYAATGVSQSSGPDDDDWMDDMSDAESDHHAGSSDNEEFDDRDGSPTHFDTVTCTN